MAPPFRFLTDAAYSAVLFRPKRNRLNRSELISGKRYYIWQLVHRGNVAVALQDIHELRANTIGGLLSKHLRFSNGLPAEAS